MYSASHRIFHLSHGRHLVDLLMSRWLQRLLSAVFAMGFLAILWSILPHVSKPSLPAPSRVNPAPGRDPMATAQRIAESHLFGQDTREPAGGEPASAADVQVDGLLYSDDRGSAWAILKVNGETGIFQAGDTLPDGERLVAIARTAVQLSHGPSIRIVELRKDFGSGGAGIVLTGDVALTDSDHALFPGTGGAVTSGLRPVSLPQKSDPLTQLRSLRQQLIKH